MTYPVAFLLRCLAVLFWCAVVGSLPAFVEWVA